MALLLVALFVVGAAVVLWQQWRAQTQIVEFMAREDAQAYTEALATFRTVYTSNVVLTARKHGMLSHRRLYRDGEVLDIDEWESVEGRERFLAEAAPYLLELREARGSAPVTSKGWQLEP